MDWRLQVFKQSLTARVPFGNDIRRAKRRVFGYKPDPDNLATTLQNLEQMKRELGALGRKFDGVVLEIGSGWFPLIPVVLAAEGARHIVMTDLNPHMDDVTSRATFDYLRQHTPYFDTNPRIASPADLPATYLAPFHPSELEDESLDYVISRTVLEHIPPDDLVDLLSALRSKLRPEGLMVHLIDNSDHLEFNDKSVSRINFLTWSQRKHTTVNAMIRGGENRLRHHQYPPLFKQAGFDVLSEYSEVDQATLARIDSLDLQPPFSVMTPEQLAVLTSIFILAPSNPAGHH